MKIRKASPRSSRAADSHPFRWSSRSRWLAAAFIGLAGFAGLAARAHGQGTVTTGDGLSLTLSSSGSVSALKSGSTNYSSSLPSGFFLREPDLTPPQVATNGSYESGSGTPTGWTISSGKAGTWSIDSTNASAGSRSMKVNIPGSIPQRSNDLLSGYFPLAPNTPYKLSCSIKTSGLNGYFFLYLLQQDSTGAWSQTGVQSLSGTNGWRTHSVTIHTKPNAIQGYLKAYISSGYGTAWLDDLKLSDVFGGAAPVAFGGSVTSSGGVLTQTASKAGINLSAKFTSVGSAIKVDATLTDTTGADRGVELAFRLPLDIPGWTWNTDIATPKTILEGTRYEYSDYVFGLQTADHSHAMFPFATVHNSSAAFSLAAPMGPLMYRFSYDNAYGFRVTYDVGLSSATTKNPSKATVSFWIYTNNAKWGMRSAAEKYYALNPNYFTTTSTLHGTWVLDGQLDIATVPVPEDFGWGYDETDNELAFNNAHNILGLHYISFPHWNINISGYSSQPTYDALVDALMDEVVSSGTGEDGIPKDDMAAAVVATSPHDENNKYQLGWHSYFWYGNRLQKYPVATYSTMANGVYPLRIRYSVDNRIANATSKGDTLGGVFLDNTTSIFGNIENYRKSLWAYNNGPLSFSYRTGETIQYNGDSMGDMLKALRGHLNNKGLVLMASITPGSYVWFSPHTDVVGGEVGGAETLDRVYARRTLSYGKIWTNLYVPGSTVPNQAQVLAYLRQGLMFGFLPGFNGVYWDSSPAYERDRGLFRKYVPLIKTISKAGWKPVNYATSSDATTLLERFGSPSAGTFYVTAQNPGTSPKSVQITLDGAGLGIAATTAVTVTELLSNTSRSLSRNGTNITLAETLDPGETTAYKVAVAGSTTTPTPTRTPTSTGPSPTPTRTPGAGAPVAQYTWSPSTPSTGQSVQFTDLSSNSPTSWSWNFGDGGTSTSKNPTHVFNSGGSYRVTLTARNASGSSLGEHWVTVKAGKPNAQFTWSPANPAKGQSVQFTDLSSNSPTSWTWDFDDGGTSTSKNPKHTFAAPGSYRVKLTSRNASGSDVGEHTVTVR